MRTKGGTTPGALRRDRKADETRVRQTVGDLVCKKGAFSQQGGVLSLIPHPRWSYEDMQRLLHSTKKPGDELRLTCTWIYPLTAVRAPEVHTITRKQQFDITQSNAESRKPATSMQQFREYHWEHHSCTYLQRFTAQNHASRSNDGIMTRLRPSPTTPWLCSAQVAYKNFILLTIRPRPNDACFNERRHTLPPVPTSWTSYPLHYKRPKDSADEEKTCPSKYSTRGA